MNIYIGADHAGFILKNYLIDFLQNSHYLTDLGAYSADSIDYPDVAHKMALQINAQARGILICGSGLGMSIAANRHTHIRAALCHNIEYAKLAREHNNANVLILGARFINNLTAIEILKIFLNTPYILGRHCDRIEKLSDF